MKDPAVVCFMSDVDGKAFSKKKKLPTLETDKYEKVRLISLSSSDHVGEKVGLGNIKLHHPYLTKTSSIPPTSTWNTGTYTPTYMEFSNTV